MLNSPAPSSRRDPSPLSARRRRSARAVMLSAVGAAALVGSAASLALLPAHAEAPATQVQVGPPSFADMVDRVK